MKVQAEISVYPLKTTELSGPIDEFCRTLQAHGFEVQTGPMSSSVSGECKDLFKSVQEAFEQLTEKYQVVMVTKISNACPQVNNDRQF
ncbi:MAG: thiamine-binding protein [Sedimentisphaerales bacterium]|nr:thiamine-binding protein [Sedimentisphaerales bacterium]